MPDSLSAAFVVVNPESLVGGTAKWEGGFTYDSETWDMEFLGQFVGGIWATYTRFKSVLDDPRYSLLHKNFSCRSSAVMSFNNSTPVKNYI